MAAVTQRIPNYLGGVSQQTDDLKFPGQLRSCINGYSEPTFGMIKRPGGSFLAELKDSNGDVITSSSAFDDGKWFTIFRDSTEQYVGVIKGTAISIWSLVDGARKTVSYGTNATSYLDTTKDNYDVLTINDVTFIINKTKVVTTQAAPAYTLGRRATVRLLSVEYGAKYKIELTNTATSAVTTVQYITLTEEPAGPPTPGVTTKVVSAENILNEPILGSSSGGGLAVQIAAASAGYTVTVLPTSLEITAGFDFTVKVTGGQDGDAMSSFQDSVANISKLPTEAVQDRTVEIANTSANEDNYYVKFVAENGVSGTGYWEESRSPTVSPGINAGTMPHVLVRNANGTFTFAKADGVSYANFKWEDRLVGDNLTNPDPSFVGNTIQQLFFYNNRLGILSEESVVASQSGDFFNFYVNSALTSIASDPIDISCSSIKPAKLHAVLPTAQGLVLFSSSQQFLLQSDQGILTPTNVLIKTISNYEMDTVNDPVDLGTTIAFISKTPSYTRVFEMLTRGQDESPFVKDISKIVPEWIPSTVDQVVSSPQNGLLSLGSTNSRDLYLFKFYTNGNERQVESWTQWKLSGGILHHVFNQDVVWAVTKQNGSYVIQKIPLIQSPTSATFLTADGSKVDPRLDMWSLPSSKTYVSTPGDQHTKIYLPFIHDTNRTLCVVTSNPNANTPGYTNAGLVLFPTVLQDGGGYYAKVSGLNLSAIDLIIGYTYDYELELPKTYFRTGDNQQVTDYTASLILSRMKFSFGLGGDVTFKLKAMGRSEWVDTQAVRDADYYLANDIPFASTSQFTVPIHQRSENIRLKIFSSSPFPVTLVSMNWEGNYSPRFYRRA